MIADVSEPSYYYPFIIIYVSILVVVQLAILAFRPKEDPKKKLDEEEKALVEDPEFFKKGEKLRIVYMIAFLLSKGSMWAKAPYTYMLFSTYHKLNVGQIGLVYMIDAGFNLIFGPFVGLAADTFGRKIIAMMYPLFSMVVLVMRMTGNIPLLCIGQMLAGVTGGILATSFEAWLNYEMLKLYGHNKIYIQYYRKYIFQNVMFYDSAISIGVTVIGAVLYNLFGILVALSFSLILAGSGTIWMMFTWDENKPNEKESVHFFTSLCTGAALLKDKKILCIGIMDSVYSCAIQAFVFIWTPVLQMTADNPMINPGMIFTLMLIAYLVHNKCLEFMNTTFKIDFFVLGFVFLVFYMINFLLVYYVNDFTTRLMCLIIINGGGGLFQPVLSYLRSVILVEQYRTLLMNLFRVPLNVIVLLLLFLTNYVDPFKICLIIGLIIILPILASIYLVYCHLTKKIDETPHQV